ncbi:MAG: TIGR01777 family oxidoreductase [Pseudomonadota bacterium]|nr:TIGR01777 family oxidoreductase [Pseudomonadota bacterium]
MKKIVICGATGMVGSRLTKQLHAKGHRLILVGREPAKIHQRFPFDVEAVSWNGLSSIDAAEVGHVINLSGAGAGDARWTNAHKALMRDSRLRTTRDCVTLCGRNPAIRLINASAVSAYGFYSGDHLPFAEADRDKRSGTCYLQELADEWEETALDAKASGNGVVLLRIGFVLDHARGGLPKMAQPYRFFIGGPAGSGEQIVSWIGLSDLVNGIEFIVQNLEIDGPVNLVSPGSCSQKEFSSALGKALGKPSFLRTPSWMIKTLLGQMGEELVLTGQRVVPQRLLQAGFVFKDDEIGALLMKLYQDR